MESQETVNQSDGSTNHRFILDLIILYGGVILILGFVLGTMAIKWDFKGFPVSGRLCASGGHQHFDVRFLGFRERENAFIWSMERTLQPWSTLSKPLQFLNIALILAWQQSAKFGVVNSNVGAQKQGYEPLIFSLVQHCLPHDDHEDGEQATISSRIVYALMALATLGLPGSWLLCGISPTR